MAHDILLFAAIAVRPAVLALLPQFERSTGLRVAAKWELNPVVKKQIEAGEPFDIVITNPNLVEDLVASQKILKGSQRVFGRIAMGVAAKAGSLPIDVRSTAAFKRVLQDAKSIAYSNEGTSGAYFRGLLERLQLAEEVTPKLVTTSAGQTASAVGRGEAELAVVPVTSILAAAPDVALAGQFPQELQSYIDFAVGISADSANAVPAGRLSDFLLSSAVNDVLVARGIERSNVRESGTL